MCTTDTVGMGWMGAVAISTTEVFVPAGGWLSTAGITAARGWCEVAGRTGSFQARPAVQHTNDVRTTGSWTSVAVGSLLSSNGVSDPAGNTSLTLGSSRYVRVGWLVSLATGSTLAGGNLAGVIELVKG